MHIANFQQAEETLGKLVPVKLERAYKLDRMKQLMHVIGDPQEKVRIVHVAGTAGKTSTSYYIAKMLQLSGHKVGLSVSPHLITVNERAQINGEPLPEATFCKLLEQFLGIKEVAALRPTYFETLVAFGYWIFAREQVDYAVIEVGLGGLLDGTNVVRRADKVCVITDIGFDHVHILGDTLEKIALQKAGIIQPGNVVFMLEQPDEVLGAVYQYADKQDATLFIHTQSFAVPARLPLYQRRNWSLARDVYDYIAERDGLPDLAPVSIEQWSVPGRMELIGDYILDGAHSPSKFEALAEALQDQYADRELTFIIGVKAKAKYIGECLDVFAPLAQRILLVPTAKLRTPESLDTALDAWKSNDANHTHPTIEVDPDIETAIQRTAEADLVVITGSLYLLGPAKEVLLAE